MTDPIADMLTRIRNAVAINKMDVLVPASKIKFEIAKILEREGFINKLIREDKKDKNNHSPYLHLVLKYKNDEPVIKGLKRISTPGRRVYRKYQEIPKVLPSLGVLVISTSKGLMTNAEAKKQKIGGEILCEIH